MATRETQLIDINTDVKGYRPLSGGRLRRVCHHFTYTIPHPYYSSENGQLVLTCPDL